MSSVAERRVMKPRTDCVDVSMRMGERACDSLTDLGFRDAEERGERHDGRTRSRWYRTG